ncbi:MAG TPA: ChbG/HpnK family deacetylase [Acidimicrobiales bacterium]|nr:ChbG/HpnK family deacetylase [Acidimicrobiales bacterium]
MSDIRLVVQGDDLGMCRAVNEGIALATTDGILTQASVMAPTPWFAEGATMVRRIALPVGLHVTLTCEWDYLRWSPLSPAATLRGPDGTFHRTVEDAATADATEAVVEAHAQADRAEALGLTITYVDPHMGISVPAAYEAMCERFRAKFIYRGIEPHHEWTSLIVLSLAPDDDRPAWLAERLEALGPGAHFVLSHPAVESDELRAITDQSNENFVWAEPIRIRDLAALCDSDVRHVIERRGIELIAARDVA